MDDVTRIYDLLRRIARDMALCSNVIVIVRNRKISDLIGTNVFLRRETNSMQAFPKTLPLARSGMDLASETTQKQPKQPQSKT